MNFRNPPRVILRGMQRFYMAPSRSRHIVGQSNCGKGDGHKSVSNLTSAAVIGLLGTMAVGTKATAQTPHQGHSADHRLYTPDAIRWTAAPPSFRRGAEASLLYGDPSREGPFVLRLRFPDGYVIAPHRHAGAEILTVLSGTFALGVGEDATRGEVTRMSAGSFTAMPGGMPHYARAEGETVVQLNSIGPWSITYINPSDDPRRQ